MYKKHSTSSTSSFVRSVFSFLDPQTVFFQMHNDKTDNNRTSSLLNNNNSVDDIKDDGVNFTKTFCEPVMNVMRLSEQRTTTELQQEKSMPASSR